MKSIFKSLGSLLLILTFGIQGFSQSTEAEIVDEFYKADPHISIILNYLPENWTLGVNEHQFIFESKDTVWVLMENRINAPFEDRTAQIERIKTFGRQVKPSLLISYESRWSMEKTQYALIQNSAIDEELRKLPAKMQITHLFNNILSSKHMPVYTPTNKQEEEALTKYEQEKARLESKKVRMPDFNTRDYSLFIEEMKGANDEMHLVYPEEPSVALFTILSTIREVCGK